MSITESAVSRRAALLGWTGAAVAASAVLASETRAHDDAPRAMPKPYVLPELPYAKNALEGFLSAEILELHHDKHHAGYVKGLNGALEALEAARAKGDLSAVKALTREVAFHGSGHILHSLYWTSMSPKGGGKPKGELARLIDASFGSFDGFRLHFAATTKAAEASGWGILAFEPLGQRLVVLAAESHQQMGLQGAVPLIVCDVWEHAYYLAYQNRRADYVDKFMEVVDWDSAGQRLIAATRLL